MPTTTDALLKEECNAIVALQGFNQLGSKPQPGCITSLTPRSAVSFHA